MIRLAVPSIEEDDLQAVRDVLASGYLVQGPRVEAFEHAVADYVGTKYAVAISSGTAALHLSLLALDVCPGDIVVVSAYSWIATANVIELCGAQPVFVDICPDTFNMDPERLESEVKRLKKRPDTASRVKCVLPVHTFGQMADMEAIMEIASRYNLPVVEDAACALGAALNGQQGGTWGVMGCFSFHPLKAITTGEGGMITTSDVALARRLRALRNHGQDPDAALSDFIMPGFNYRMTEFQAALGLTQMTKLERIIATRHRLVSDYNELLRDTRVRTPAIGPGSQPVHQSYVTLLPDNAVAWRADLIRHMHNQGIETNIGTCHMPMTTYFKTRYDYKLGDFPVSDDIANRALTLPLYERLEKPQQREVIHQLLSLISDERHKES